MPLALVDTDVFYVNPSLKCRNIWKKNMYMAVSGLRGILILEVSDDQLATQKLGI